MVIKVETKVKGLGVQLMIYIGFSSMGAPFLSFLFPPPPNSSSRGVFRRKEVRTFMGLNIFFLFSFFYS